MIEGKDLICKFYQSEMCNKLSQKFLIYSNVIDLLALEQRYFLRD